MSATIVRSQRLSSRIIDDVSFSFPPFFALSSPHKYMVPKQLQTTAVDELSFVYGITLFIIVTLVS